MGSILIRGHRRAVGNGGHVQEEARSAALHRACRLFADPLPSRQPGQRGSGHERPSGTGCSAGLTAVRRVSEAQQNERRLANQLILKRGDCRDP